MLINLFILHRKIKYNIVKFKFLIRYEISMESKYRFDEILSSLRAYLAKILIEKYNLNNKEISNLLGITPSAISQYIKGKRGKLIKKLNKEFKENVSISLLIENYIRDILKRKESGVPLHELYFIDLSNEIFSILVGMKLEEKIKKVKLKTEQIRNILQDRINLEINAAQKCLKMVSLVKDDFVKLLLRMIASDSIRHADILSLVLAKIEGKVEIEYEKLSEEFIIDMLKNEEEAKEVYLKDLIKLDHPIVKLLLKSIDLDEEKHMKILHELKNLKL